jgi:DNA integrity scanning protein DisA with diadenylate cyclase activity
LAIQYTAFELARLAKTVVIRVKNTCAVYLDEHLLLVGEYASDDEIASVATRKGLADRDCHSELDVARIVESHGFRYVPPTQPRAKFA